MKALQAIVLSLVGGLCSIGCSEPLPPAGQVLLYINTDAPLPAAQGAAPHEVPALFDRLRIDLYEPQATTPCAGCSRVFNIDQQQISTGQASIGIVPAVGRAGYRARVRLYRSGGTAAAEPRPQASLETVVELPSISAEGLIEVNAMLWTDDIGNPVGSLDAPISANPGPPQPGLAGSWWGAQRRDCEGTPRPGEVCVPGGAFWMGDPRLDLSSSFDQDGALERLVVLSPFYLHASEVTVAAFRESGLAIYLSPGQSDDPYEAGGSIPSCNYTSQPGEHENEAVACISWRSSDGYCRSLGETLPSEAQLEYAMSAMGQHRFVWGEGSPGCEDAVYDRNGGVCGGFFAGVAPIGSGARDRLSLNGDIVDLAGNVREWAADRWNREAEACWGTGLFVDPLCQKVSVIDGDARSIRGGDWSSEEVSLRAALRSRLANENYAVSASLGFRCVRTP